MTAEFSDILATLEKTDHLQRIELFNPDGSPAGTIENKPGSQGSVRVYHHLWKKWGSINTDAAKDGLAIYCEHTGDAKLHPGKHPNIDRLFHIAEKEKILLVKVVKT